MSNQPPEANLEASSAEQRITVSPPNPANPSTAPPVEPLPINHNTVPPTRPALAASILPLEQGSPTGHQATIVKVGIPLLPRQWLPFCLNPLGLSLLMAGEIAIILTVGILYHFSRQNNGFVAVPDSPSSFWDGSWAVHDKLLWSYALLWTFMPAFVMGLYASHWKDMVKELGKRDPFVLKEMPTPKPSKNGHVVSKSPSWKKNPLRYISKLCGKPPKQLGENPTSGNILVDYGSLKPFQDIYEAIHDDHWVLGTGMLIGMVLSPVLSSLSAAVLTTASVHSNSTIPLTANYFFNDSVMVSNTSLRPAFDIVAATRIYGGMPPPWTTETYAFLPFTSTSNSTSGNITATTSGYSVQLDCEIITPKSYQVVTSAVTETAVEIQLSFDDRDCFNTPSLQVSPGIPTYVQSWANTTCSSSSGWSRIGLLAGQYSATSAINVTSFSVISCIPTYYTTTGLVTVSVAPGASPVFITLTTPDVNATIEDRPSIWRILEDNLQYYTIFDPTDEFRMNDFSRVVYTYASRRNASTAFTAEALASSMSDVFTAFYAAFVGTSIIAPTSSVQAMAGSLSSMQNKLFVFEPIAFVIISVVGLAFLCNVAVFFHVRRTVSAQDQDSGGVLSHAVLMDGSSEFHEIMSDVKKNRSGETNLMDAVRNQYDVRNASCWWEWPRIRLNIPERDANTVKVRTWYSRAGHLLADMICCLVCPSS